VLTGAMVAIEAASRATAVIFLGIMWVQSLARLALFHAYARRPRDNEDWRPWALWFSVGTLIGGFTIGTGSIWMVSAQRGEMQLTALLLIFAVTGGAVGAFGAYLPAFY